MQIKQLLIDVVVVDHLSKYLKQTVDERELYNYYFSKPVGHFTQLMMDRVSGILSNN